MFMTKFLKKSFLFLVLVMFAGAEYETGFAEISHWAVFGPTGGSIHTVAVDPQNPDTIYAAAHIGMFKSTDGGANWRRTPGLEQVLVTSILIDPQNSSNIYAASWARVLKSTDAGMSWNAMNFQPVTGSLNHPGFFVLAIDPQNPATIYAGHWNGCQGEGCPTAQVTDGLFKSTDGGATWKKTFLSSMNVYSVAVDPQQSNVLYAGTIEGLYRSADAGETWRKIAGIDVAGWGSVVVPDPQDARTVYIGTADGVFKSTDRGGSWNQIWRFGYINPISSLLIDPHDPGILYVFALDGYLKSTDAGASWQDVGTSAPFLLAWDPKTPGTIYATKYEYELDESLFVKSTDGGASWRRLYSGIVATNVSIAVDPQIADSVYAWTQHRLFKSTDGARRWHLVSLSPLTEGDFLLVAVAPQNSRIMYASKQSGLYKSTDGGVSWVAANTGLPPAFFIRHLRIDPQDSKTVYVSIANTDPFPIGPPASSNFRTAVFKTTDGGASWNRIGAESLSEIRAVLSFAVSPQKPHNLYAAYYHPTSVELYRSSDGGSNWSQVDFPAVGPVSLMDITFDPQNSDTVYAVAGCALLKSTDGGTTWTPITSRVANCLAYVRVEVENGNTLYAATGSLFKSTDGGVSWSYESDVRGSVSSVAIDRNSNRKYATVWSGGVYATFDSPPQETPRPLLTLNSTGCIGQIWNLKVNAQTNSAIYLFGNSNAQTWEIEEWGKTNAIGAYEATGTFANGNQGRHILYVDVDGATSNDVSFRVANCSSK
jgi:photosystem II stability/assembly factor-like uncharacterized protein